MSISYYVGLVYRHAVLVVRGVELSNDVEAEALVKLSEKCSDRGRIVTLVPNVLCKLGTVCHVAYRVD